MGGIGGMELLVVGLVALIVVGPKDLPGMFRTIGQFTGKAKRMAREFSSAMEAAADDAGVADVTSTLRDISNPKKMGLDAVKKAVDFDDPPEKLSKDRAEVAEKIRAKTAEAATTRQQKAAETAEAATTPKTPAAKKPASKKASTKQPAAKKPAAKKTAARKTPAKAPAKTAAKATKTKKADT